MPLRPRRHCRPTRPAMRVHRIVFSLRIPATCSVVPCTLMIRLLHEHDRRRARSARRATTRSISPAIPCKVMFQLCRPSRGSWPATCEQLARRNGRLGRSSSKLSSPARYVGAGSNRASEVVHRFARRCCRCDPHGTPRNRVPRHALRPNPASKCRAELSQSRCSSVSLSSHVRPAYFAALQAIAIGSRIVAVVVAVLVGIRAVLVFIAPVFGFTRRVDAFGYSLACSCPGATTTAAP